MATAEHISKTLQTINPQPGPPASENGLRRRSENLDSQPEYPYPYSARRVAAYQAELSQQAAPMLCPECGGAGYVKKGNFLPGHPDFGKIEHCPTCKPERRVKWLAKNCGLDEAEQGSGLLSTWKAGNWTGENPETQGLYRSQRLKARQIIQKAIEGRVGLFTFYGDFGSGKTKALQVVANESRLQMVESFYAPFSLLLEHLRSLYAQKQDSSAFWQRLLDIPVLCVDEVTRFNETSWAREKLFTLADTRYRRRASHLTLFATNDEPGQYLPPTEDIGYLYSRMRQGKRIELRGDMREVVE